MTDRLHRDDDPHDDAIPGPTDDTYKSSDRTVRSGTADDATSGTSGRGEAAGQDEQDDDAGERRFDYS